MTHPYFQVKKVKWPTPSKFKQNAMHKFVRVWYKHKLRYFMIWSFLNEEKEVIGNDTVMYEQ